MPSASHDVDSVRPTRIRRFSEAVAAMPGGIDLAIGDLRPPDFWPADHVRQAAIDAINAGFSYYPPIQGIPELLDAILQKLERENNISKLSRADVLVTNGATEALYLGLSSVLEVGDEVLVPDPGHDIYDPMVQIARGSVVNYPLRVENGFQPAIADLKSLLSPRTKVLLINTPNSPTGSVFNVEALQAYADFATAHDLWIMTDEPYERFVYGRSTHTSVASLPAMRERTMSAFALSKTYAITGWRIGYLLAPDWIIEQAIKRHRNMLSGINLIAQKAAIAALSGPDDDVINYRNRLDSSRGLLIDFLRSISGVECTDASGTFYCYPNVSALGTAGDIAERLLREGIAVVPGDAWGTFRSDDYLRFSFSQPIERIEEALPRIQKALQ